MFFAGTFVVLLLNGVWSLFVGTASMGGDESELVQGWSGVLRNSPAYLLLVVVAFLGVVFATKAGVHGSNRANAALIATSIALLFALASVTRDGGSRHDDSGGHRRMDRLRRGRDRSGHRSRCGSPSDETRLLTLTIVDVRT